MRHDLFGACLPNWLAEGFCSGREVLFHNAKLFSARKRKLALESCKGRIEQLGTDERNISIAKIDYRSAADLCNKKTKLLICSMPTAMVTVGVQRNEKKSAHARFPERLLEEFCYLSKRDGSRCLADHKLSSILIKESPAGDHTARGSCILVGIGDFIELRRFTYFAYARWQKWAAGVCCARLRGA